MNRPSALVLLLLLFTTSCSLLRSGADLRPLGQDEIDILL